MAQPAEKHDPYQGLRENPSLDALGVVDEPWTAQLAFDLLPETKGPRIEVFRGSVIVTPHASVDHQAVERDLAYLMHQAARRSGYWAFPEINVIFDEDLFVPDVAVLRVSGAGLPSVSIADAVLLGEIVSPNRRRKDVIDHPRIYASAGVPWYLRIEFRNRVPALTLHQLVDGEYQPVVAAAAGTTFEMTEPFAFAIDPGELLDD